MLQMLLYLVLMGIIGAFIGWSTNAVAIRMLFRPYTAYRVPVAGWMVQGLIPKRQEDIARVLGRVVSSELVTGEDVANSLSRDDIKEKLADKLQGYLKNRLLEKMPVIVPSSLQMILAEFVGRLVHHEAMVLLANPEKVLPEEERETIKTLIGDIVQEKVRSFDFHHLEKLVYLVARRELKHIELLGGVLGFAIGVVQGVISLYLSSSSVANLL